MKLAIVEAMFPDLRGGSIYKSARGTGGTKRVAIARAMGALLKTVSGKQVNTIKVTIHLSDLTTDPPKPFNATAAQVAKREAARERCTCENNGDRCDYCQKLEDDIEEERQWSE